MNCVLFQDLQKVDMCINNAGMSSPESLLDGKYENWKKMMNINVVGDVFFSSDK